MFGKYWIVFKIMGLGAFQSTEAPFRYSWWSSLSGYTLVISSVSVVSYLLANIYVKQNNSFISSFKDSQTAEIVLWIDKATLLITSMICLLCGTFHTKSLFRIVNKFEHSRELENYSDLFYKRFRTGILLFVFLIVLMISEIVYSGNYTSHFPLFYLRLFMFANIFMFTSAVLTLYVMFRTMNGKLNESFGCRDLGLKRILPLVDYVKGMINTKPFRGFDALRELSAVHWKLCMLGSDINEAFNSQLMAIFIAVLVRIVTRPYFIFLSVEYATRAVDTVYIIINSGWVLVYWMQLCLLVWSCSLASHESEQTSTIIVHNLNKQMPTENRKMMEMFLLQLSNHKLNFTVYDMFTIDLSVLTSVAGAVTTYLVILIQFQTSHS